MRTITLRWEAAALAAVGLLVAGAASGLAVQAEPVVKAPYQCRVMANLATETFEVYEAQVISIHNQATRGRSEFARHAAAVERQWVQIDELRDKHAVAREFCLGGAR
jgi:hypothetical protein